MSETATMAGDDRAEVQRRTREAAAAHWTDARAEIERLEGTGATAAEVTAELARRWSAWARFRLWGKYPAETAGRCEAALSAVLHHLYLPGGDPLAEFPVNRGDLVRWGAVETVRDGGLALRDLSLAGVLGRGSRGRPQPWRIPARAVCPPPAKYPVFTADRWETDRWEVPDAWAVPDAPAPVFAELGPLSWSVWVSLPLSETVDLEAVADDLRMDEPWIAEVLGPLSERGLVDASVTVGGGWFRRSVAEASAR